MMMGVTAPSVMDADSTVSAFRSRMIATFTSEMACARRNASLMNVPRWDLVIAGRKYPPAFHPLHDRFADAGVEFF
jgi:hypothetical protein